MIAPKTADTGRHARHLRLLLDHCPLFAWIKDGQGRFLAANSAFARLVGQDDPAALIGRTDGDLFPADLAARYQADDQAVLAAGQSKYAVEPYPDAQGRRHWMESWKTPLLEEGRVVGIIGYGRDIGDRQQLDQTLSVREQHYRTLVEQSADMIARYDREGRRLYVNSAFAALVGVEMERLHGTTPSQIPGGDHIPLLRRHMETVFSTGEPLEFELDWTNLGNRPLTSLVRFTPEFDGEGRVASVLGQYRDITELQASRRKLHRLAFHDELTGLPNRALLQDRLRQAITDAMWHKRSVCVMMVDLDQFKAVNDAMGHAAGDELLRAVAHRLSESVRAYDTVARLGGDEFIIVMPEVRDGADLGRIANKILRAVDQPYQIQGHEIYATCCIGIALYPNDGGDGGDLLKYADTALYLAKQEGRGAFRFYSKTLTASAMDRLMIESGLRHALARDEMELHFQPQIDFASGAVVGSEALLRWHSPLLGQVPPDRFIPVAEDTGMIIELGAWVLRQACQAASAWNGPGRPRHKVAVNLSSRQFQRPGLLETVTATLEATGCRPGWIELEITESLLLDRDGRVADLLAAFRAMGITIAVDDFGTGYSALNYLADFAIDTLKIDKSFIQALGTDRRRAELVKAILSIAGCFDQMVVAEGVETAEQVRFLRENNCHFAQGWFYSKALPHAAMTALLTERAPLRPAPSEA